jgi:hypothetical protein
MRSIQPFHLAFGITDLCETPKFYEHVLGCIPGRSTDQWIDFDFFGHQLSLHLRQEQPNNGFSKVEEDAVPIPHFGAVLTYTEFDELIQRFNTHRINPELGPKIRYSGLESEQRTMFVRDPSGNVLEFKAYKNPSAIFRKND